MKGSLRPLIALSLLVGPAFTGSACNDAPVDSAPTELGPEPATEPPAPQLRRLTTTQYQNSIRDLLGDGLIQPSNLEPDSQVGGLYSVGASQISISSLGVEEYEAAAFDLASQVLQDPTYRDALVPCEPLATIDDDCAWDFIETFGREAWRRPLTDDEILRLVDVAAQAAAALDDFYLGLEYALAGVLQSPYFLYRIELGEVDDDGVRRLTDLELASRLSYLFWNTTPDAELLSLAEADELSEPDVLGAQIDRLLADERSREGVRNFFTEMFELDLLDELSKDYLVFPHMSPSVGPSAREETLMGLEYIVFDEDGDYRDALTSQRAFVDRTLAAIYNIPAPERDGFGEVWLDADQGRRGLLGQVSFLAGNAHATSSSATLRGKFVRNKLLCQEIPPPPADVDASLPEPAADAPTLRDRIDVHLEDPTCASCHNLTDYIGLGLENFDGIGRWRLSENDHAIDPSGNLDGAGWSDAWDMAQVVRAHERTGPCLTETMYRYATGRSIEDGEVDAVDWLAESFAASGYSVQSLMRQMATSEAFRRVGEIED